MDIIKLIDERILVKEIEKTEQTYNGIIIPSNQKQEENMGIVEAIGTDIIDKRIEKQKLSEIVKIGDKVIFSKFAGTNVTINDVNYILIHRNDILAVVNNQGANN